jgi:sigma-54 dependent transcriptional regulator, acetoin dehydrogenase operon transcriptional activator AcoR
VSMTAYCATEDSGPTSLSETLGGTAPLDLVVSPARCGLVDVRCDRSDGRDGPNGSEVDPEGRFEHAALAELERAADELAGTSFSLVVADELARVVVRVDGNPKLAGQLDRLHLAPGYVWSEPCVGPNAIERALSDQATPGGQMPERLAEPLRHTACVAVPITDPRRGRPLGVVALVCRGDASTALMLSYVRRVGREIENALVDAGSGAERALMAHFVHARRHARGAIVSVNERTMITNAAAARLVSESDRPALWDWGRRAVARGGTEAGEIRSSAGRKLRARCEPVESASETVGVLIRLDAVPRVSPATGRATKKRARRQTFGWASLSPSQLGIAELVASGLTNQEVAARLYLSRHTVDFHLRAIFSRLGIDSRVKLARLVTERRPDDESLAS